MKPDNRILLACPISSHKDYCLWWWLSWVQQFADVDYYFVDNSPDPAHADKVRAMGYEVDYLKPYSTISKTIAVGWNMIRDRVRSGGYDYHFSLECDVFPTLQQWIKLRATMDATQHPVLGYTYWLGNGENAHLMLGEVHYYPLSGKVLNDVLPAPTSAHRMNGQIRECGQLGQGCLLIHRSVYDKVKFRHVENATGVFPDTLFHEDLLRSDIPVHVITSELVTHRNQPWDILLSHEKTKPHAE